MRKSPQFDQIRGLGGARQTRRAKKDRSAAFRADGLPDTAARAFFRTPTAVSEKFQPRELKIDRQARSDVRYQNNGPRIVGKRRLWSHFARR